MKQEVIVSKTVFLINPKSGNGAAMKQVALIEEIMKEENKAYELVFTQYPMHAQELARSYRQADGVRLIGVGGDGTLNEILNGINVGVSLGIIPCGSGNDFFRMIASDKKDIKQLIKDTVDGEVVLIDYGIMNGRKFLNSCSIGFDASIALDAKQLQNKSKFDIKSGSYLWAALKGILHPFAMHATLELSNGTIRKDVLFISAMNGRWYGGGFCPAPQADLRDGMVEVSVIDFLTTAKILPLFTKYMKGKHGSEKAVTMFRVNRFTLHTKEDAQMQVDGELFVGRRFELEVVNQGLSLLVPKGEQYGKYIGRD